MLTTQNLLDDAPCQLAEAGSILLNRAAETTDVIYLEKGRVVLGVLGGGGVHELMEHQLGAVDGPSWLDVSGAVLNVPSSVDVLAHTSVQFRRVPLAQFREFLQDCSNSVQSMLLDMARAHRQQTELAVSRLAKGAESRCAEWLLSQAQTSDQGGCAVYLQQRKRNIAAQLGIAPETLSRVLRHLREMRLISGSGRVLDLVDPVGLRTLAGASAPCSCGVV